LPSSPRRSRPRQPSDERIAHVRSRGQLGVVAKAVQPTAVDRGAPVAHERSGRVALAYVGDESRADVGAAHLATARTAPGGAKRADPLQVAGPNVRAQADHARGHRAVPVVTSVPSDLARDARDASAKTRSDRTHGLARAKHPLDITAVVVGQVAVATGNLRHGGSPLGHMPAGDKANGCEERIRGEKQGTGHSEGQRRALPD
jgi:hypothetical protein